MRTLEEIRTDMVAANTINDAPALLALAEEMQGLGTPQAQAAALNASGTSYRVTGDYQLALEHFRQALQLYLDLGDREGAARIHGNIGIVYQSTGEHALALEYGHKALAVYEEQGDRKSTATSTGSLGIVYASIGDYPRALEHFGRAMQMHEELGNHAIAALVTANIGNVYGAIGDHQRAAEHFHRAIEVFAELGDRTSVATVTGNLGLACSGIGDYPQALKHYQNSLDIYGELGNRFNEARITGSIARTLLEMNRDEEAAEHLEQQSSMVMDDPHVHAIYHQNRALLAEHRGDLDEAWEQHLQAKELLTQAGARDSVAGCHLQLRDLAKKRNDFEGYVEHNDAHHRLIEETRGKEATQKMALMEADRKVEGERRERIKERALLYGALPEHIATRLLRGETIEDHFENAAVLFADIAGFTTHSSSMHPSETIKLLEDIYKHFDAICAEHGVTKVKTIGDSYLCFAGSSLARARDDNSASASSLARARDDNSSPSSRDSEVVIPSASEEPHTTAAERIAAVALAMQNVEFYWPTSVPEGSLEDSLERLALRIGVHSGPLTAGVIGTQRMQYDIWGDTVNVASRMESTGEPGRIQCSESFASSLARARDDKSSSASHESDVVIPSASEEPHSPFPIAHSLRERGSVEIKGKGSMTTYWLEGAE